jgi:hypothetical protein
MTRKYDMFDVSPEFEFEGHKYVAVFYGFAGTELDPAEYERGPILRRFVEEVPDPSPFLLDAASSALHRLLAGEREDAADDEYRRRMEDPL